MREATLVLGSQREGHPDSDDAAAARAIEAAVYATQPGADAVGGLGDEALGRELHRRDRARHDRELHEEAALRIDELRQESGEEEDALGVGHGRKESLAEERLAIAVDTRSSPPSIALPEAHLVSLWVGIVAP